MATEEILGCFFTEIQDQIQNLDDQDFSLRKETVLTKDYFSHNIEGIVEKKNKANVASFSAILGAGR